jgi:hypothetical protein
MKRKPQSRKRRNPDALDAAAAVTEEFHGRPAKKITVVEETEAEHTAVAELGRLLELHIITGEGKRFRLAPRGVKLCATADRKNLLFVGGDQEFDLASIGLETDKDQLPLGELEYIVYATKKSFHNFEATDYVHKLGEESGVRPLLEYSVLNHRFYLSGGRYEVRPEGIVD